VDFPVEAWPRIHGFIAFQYFAGPQGGKGKGAQT